MSLKDLFKKGYTKKSVAEEGQKIKKHVESRQLIKEKNYEKKHIVPYTDFSDPANFAFYGSAEKYYEDSFTRIYMNRGQAGLDVVVVGSPTQVQKQIFKNTKNLLRD